MDGSVKLDDYLSEIEARGHSYASLTDGGGLFGAFDFYLKCQQKNITPVIGSTLNVKPSQTLQNLISKWTHHAPRKVVPAEIKQVFMEVPLPPVFHLTLIAKNNRGFQLLSQLVSDSYADGLEEDIPVCSWPFLLKYLCEDSVSDLIALSGCGQGELTYHLRLQQKFSSLCGSVSSPQLTSWIEQLSEATLTYIGGLSSLMGEGGLYMEIFDHNFGYEKAMKSQWKQISQTTAIPMVASSDAYYLDPDHLETHIIALAIKNSLTETELIRSRRDVAFHLMDDAEFIASFQDMDGALENTLRIARECSHLNWNTTANHLPSFPLEEGVDVDQWLEKLASEGLAARRSSHSADSDSSQDGDYEKRLDYELSVIKKMGFSGYFLIVQDFINWSKDQKIAVGPGRGSGAGSLTAYCLGITDIDPLRWGLLFERFLNPERVSLPDFDVDFCQWRREEVIDYVFDKYGRDKVAHIGSFGKLMAKAALKNTARVMGVHYLKMNQLTKMFPDDMSLTLKEVMESSAAIAEVVEQDDRLHRAMEVAIKIEGTIAHTSIHPAGIVISDRPITHDAPTFMTSRDMCVMSQYEMKSLEKAGLVKFDLLGLKTLTVIDYACGQIQKTKNPDFSISQIPLDDQKVYQQISSGHTVGIFQAESAGMTDLARKLGPTHFEDIIALVALFRPGPLGSGMVDSFIERKHKRQKIDYLHPLLKPLLQETYGMIVYQEQVQKIASHLACYSLGEADLLRRAMGKKIPEEMKKQKDRFLAGATQQGIEPKLAGEIFDLMAEFAKYGFNKSHSAAYGLILYQTAYLKTHYPEEFMLALMTCDMDNPKKMSHYIEECQRLGIRIVSPSLARSCGGFSLSHEGELLYGLEAIKGISKKALEVLLKERNKAGFPELLDLAHRLDLHQIGKKTLELLMEAGAMDDFGYPRQKMKSQVAAMVKYSEHYQLKKNRKQPTLLTLMDASLGEEFRADPPWYQELKQYHGLKPMVTLADLITEKALLGTYHSGHPLDHYEPYIPLLAPTTTVAELMASKGYGYGRNTEHRLVMFLESQFDKTSAGGQRMMRLGFADRAGYVDGVMYQKDLDSHPPLPKNHRLVVVTGSLQRNKRSSFVVRRIDDALHQLAMTSFHLAFETHVQNASELDSSWLQEFVEGLTKLRQYPGDAKVGLFIHLANPGAQISYDLALSVDRRALLDYLPTLVGYSRLSFKLIRG